MKHDSRSSTPKPSPHESAVEAQGSGAGTTGPGPRTPTKARYIMIGGFLGSGKTTAVARLAQRLTDQSRRVGLITNDQGSGLVDTAMLRSRGFATEEIPGGCFCCRFDSLLEAANKLTAVSRPDVFIAEPVGSCTDLVATVTYPLRRIYGDNFSIAPLSVLVDPIRARRVFHLETGGSFSEKVHYIYRKQLEEADVIAINKCDLVDSGQRQVLRDKLAAEYPRAEIFEISARHGAGLDAWFDRIVTTEQFARTAMEVDYQLYGEALLGWLNGTVQLKAEDGFDANGLLGELAEELRERLRRNGAEVAHLKMTFSPDEGLRDIAVINLVRNDYVTEVSQALEQPVQNGQLIINLRAEASPDVLCQSVRSAVAGLTGRFPGLIANIVHLENFRPGKPQPTHRMTAPT
jgi:G3E family GTPase